MATGLGYVDVTSFLPRKKYTIVKEENNVAIKKELNENETKLLQQFHDKLVKDYPEDVKDTLTLVKFLRARKWNLEASEKMYRHRMKWIEEFKPHLITEGDAGVQDEIKQGKAFWFGRDNYGRPIVVYRAANHFPNYKDINDAFKFLVILVEIGLQLLPPPPYNQLIAIYDRRGFSMSNTDMKLFSKAVQLADFYPEVLHKVYILGTNWLFKSLWAVAEKLIDPITVKKVAMLPSDEKEALKELAQMTNDANLIPIHGGDLKKLKRHHYPASTPDKFVYSTSLDAKDEVLSVEEEQKLTPIVQQNAQAMLDTSVEELNLD